MTELDQIADLIGTFFRVYQDKTVVGIQLPSGWFGRPYDNYYTLADIDVDADNRILQLDLGYGWRLSMKPYSAMLSESRRELVVAVECGEMKGLETRQSFHAGDVTFCVVDSEYADEALLASGRDFDRFE